jgi:hypothetical protein
MANTAVPFPSPRTGLPQRRVHQHGQGARKAEITHGDLVQSGGIIIHHHSHESASRFEFEFNQACCFPAQTQVRKAEMKHGDLVQFGGAAGIDYGARLNETTPQSLIYLFEIPGFPPVPTTRLPPSAQKRVTPTDSSPSPPPPKRAKAGPQVRFP